MALTPASLCVCVWGGGGGGGGGWRVQIINVSMGSFISLTLTWATNE